MAIAHAVVHAASSGLLHHAAHHAGSMLASSAYGTVAGSTASVHKAAGFAYIVGSHVVEHLRFLVNQRTENGHLIWPLMRI